MKSWKSLLFIAVGLSLIATANVPSPIAGTTPVQALERPAQDANPPIAAEAATRELLAEQREAMVAEARARAAEGVPASAVAP
jgi:hypothetical protein